MICKNPGGGTPPLISLRGGAGNGLPPPPETVLVRLHDGESLEITLTTYLSFWQPYLV